MSTPAAAAAAAAAAAGRVAVLPRYLAVEGGARHHLAALLRQMRCQTPLLLTDAHHSACGAADRLVHAITAANAGIHAQQPLVFDGCVPEPTASCVLNAVDVLRQRDHDCIVALGGGSAIDVAKAASVMPLQHRDIAQMKEMKVPANPAARLPVVALPTTAGTGSEVTQATVITDDATNEKMLCMAPAFQPVAALVDYEYTMSCPPRLSADTGLDALTHAIEAYVSRKNSPFTDSIALQAMAGIAKNIRRVFANGDDREARSAMSLASTQAGIAFSNASVALVHGMSRPLGAHFHVPHGLSNAMILPTITSFSVPSSLKRYAECAHAMGLVDCIIKEEDAATALIEELVQLNLDLKVPSMKEFGIDREEFMKKREVMAQQALASQSPLNNPRIASVEEMIDLYALAYEEGGEPSAAH